MYPDSLWQLIWMPENDYQFGSDVNCKNASHNLLSTCIVVMLSEVSPSLYDMSNGAGSQPETRCVNCEVVCSGPFIPTRYTYNILL